MWKKPKFQVFDLGCVTKHLCKVVWLHYFVWDSFVLKCEKQRYEICMVDWIFHWEGRLYRHVWWTKVEKIGLWM
jgi:hypothetical protein